MEQKHDLKIRNEDAEQVVKEVKKRGSKSASVEISNTATKAEVKDMISNVLFWRNAKPVETDDECAERLDAFFQHIGETGELPTVEKMCLALGTVRQRVWEWENGTKGAKRADMIKKAKEILAALDAELVSNNKIPQVTYIFRAKNFYAMADKSEVVLTPNTPLQNIDTETARHRILDALPEDTE